MAFSQKPFAEQSEQSVKMILCFWNDSLRFYKTFRRTIRAKCQNDTLLLEMTSLRFQKKPFAEQFEQSVKMILCFCNDSLHFYKKTFAEQFEQSVKMILCFCNDSLRFYKTFRRTI